MDTDQKYYDMVAREINSGNLDQGTWARALAETSDEGAIAKAKYIKLRVKALKATEGHQAAQRAQDPDTSTIQQNLLADVAVRAITYILPVAAIMAVVAFLNSL